MGTHAIILLLLFCQRNNPMCFSPCPVFSIHSTSAGRYFEDGGSIMNRALLANNRIRFILVRINELSYTAFLINVERATKTQTLAFFRATAYNDV